MSARDISLRGSFVRNDFAIDVLPASPQPRLLVSHPHLLTLVYAAAPSCVQRPKPSAQPTTEMMSLAMALWTATARDQVRRLGSCYTAAWLWTATARIRRGSRRHTEVRFSRHLASLLRCTSRMMACAACCRRHMHLSAGEG